MHCARLTRCVRHMQLYSANMKKTNDFPKFANQFRGRLSIVQGQGEKMAMADQVMLFRRQINVGTSLSQQTQIDHSTSKPLASLDAIMEKCRTLYVGDSGSDPKGDTLEGAGGNPIQRLIKATRSLNLQRMQAARQQLQVLLRRAKRSGHLTCLRSNASDTVKRAT